MMTRTKDKTGLTSISDAARMVVATYGTFYNWAYRDKAIPTPAKRIGRRHFYTPEQLPKVVQQVAALRCKRGS